GAGGAARPERRSSPGLRPWRGPDSRDGSTTGGAPRPPRGARSASPAGARTPGAAAAHTGSPPPTRGPAPPPPPPRPPAAAPRPRAAGSGRGPAGLVIGAEAPQHGDRDLPPVARLRVEVAHLEVTARAYGREQRGQVVCEVVDGRAVPARHREGAAVDPVPEG